MASHVTEARRLIAQHDNPHLTQLEIDALIDSWPPPLDRSWMPADLLRFAEACDEKEARMTAALRSNGVLLRPSLAWAMARREDR